MSATARRHLVIATLACAAAAGCGGQAHRAVPTHTSASATTLTAVTSTPPPPAPPPAPPARPRPRPSNPCPPRSTAKLPQTAQRPSSHTACFHAIVRALWRGLRADSPRTARYAFFPLRAYEQVKAIAEPYDDYMGRLLVDYQLDLHAAHELLGSHAPAARLIETVVPSASVRWIAPGVCYNRAGYWEVPNSRLVYRIGRQVRSFGIASLISWRGVWYVVHLGAVTRSGGGGVVDDPSDGPGESAPSLTC